MKKKRKNTGVYAENFDESNKIREISAKSLTIYIYIYIIDCTNSEQNAQEFVHFYCFGGKIMRIILDTEKGRIILPKSFFPQLDKMNKILADGGSDKKWTAETYVKDQFEKAFKETMLRAEDKVVK